MNFDIVEAVRNLLIGDSSITDLVPAAQIIAARGTLPVTYPAITLSERGTEGPNDYNMEGIFYIRIYTQNTKFYRALSAINDAIVALAGRDGKALDITDSDVTFHRFEQVYASEPLHEPDVDIDTWSIATHYAYMVTI